MALPEVCVCYLIRETPEGPQLLLGRKKTGLGLGKLVGPGGKLEPGESPVDDVDPTGSDEHEVDLSVRGVGLCTICQDVISLFGEKPSIVPRRDSDSAAAVYRRFISRAVRAMNSACSA